ncbi:MAG: SpoIIE family protein phosphatase [Bacteroidota bacterium]
MRIFRIVLLFLFGTYMSYASVNDSLVYLYHQYKSEGNYRKAFECYLEITEQKDSLDAEERQQQIFEFQEKYETEKKQQEIELLNKENRYKELQIQKKKEELRKRNAVIWSIVLGFAVVLLFSLWLFRMGILKRRANILLRQHNEYIRQQHEEITAQREEIQSQKDELEIQRDLATRQRDLITEQKKEITDSIEYARYIQLAILPATSVLGSCFNSYFIMFRPRDIVSGDFYWIAEKKTTLYLAAADCTGHGVPGAFMSLLGSSLLNDIIAREELPKVNRILEILREKVITSLHQGGIGQDTKAGMSAVRDGMDMTIVSFCKESGILEVAGANNPLYLIRERKSPEQQEGLIQETEMLSEVKGDKMPVGLSFKSDRAFSVTEIKIEKGDMFYLFSDGFADQFGGNDDKSRQSGGKKYMYRQFRAYLEEISGFDMDMQKKLLEAELERWMGDIGQVDDIMIIGCKI